MNPRRKKTRKRKKHKKDKKKKKKEEAEEEDIVVPVKSSGVAGKVIGSICLVGGIALCRCRRTYDCRHNLTIFFTKDKDGTQIACRF
ncbi:MAG: hypothetical protein L6V85_07985 [Clostridiales bacterium]|nr:MAG: hypothetical protein L6V85_07985 [Clostridiales bacterium]